jgi:hypothetical protein
VEIGAAPGTPWSRGKDCDPTVAKSMEVAGRPASAEFVKLTGPHRYWSEDVS